MNSSYCKDDALQPNCRSVFARQSVDMLLCSRDFAAYTKHRDRYDNLRYLCSIGLLILFVLTYCDIVTIICLSGKSPGVKSIGTLLAITPPWLSNVLLHLLLFFAFPLSVLALYSNTLFEVDDMDDLKAVAVSQLISAAVVGALPFLELPPVHMPAKNVIDLFRVVLPMISPIVVGVCYRKWYHQHWKLAIYYYTVPLLFIPVLAGKLIMYIWFFLISENAVISLKQRNSFKSFERISNPIVVFNDSVSILGSKLLYMNSIEEGTGQENIMNIIKHFLDFVINIAVPKVGNDEVMRGLWTIMLVYAWVSIFVAFVIRAARWFCES